MKRIILTLFVAGVSMTALAQNTRELKGSVKTGAPIIGLALSSSLSLPVIIVRSPTIGRMVVM